MSNPYRPFDADRPMRLGCACGKHASAAEHAADGTLTDAEQRRASDPQALAQDFVEAVLMRALFPHDAVRRRFIRAVGAGTARAALASVVPLASLQALAQERRTPEKPDLKIGFIAITCATPLIMAQPLGFYQRQGLNVQLNKTAGWALIRDRMLNREHDASHFLSPMPIAISQGLGSVAQPMRVAAIQNTNGQAITLHISHRQRRDPRTWKGFRFAVPFEFSMHNFLLRYYVAEHGLDPDRDIQIRVVPPPEMVANLRAGNIDGYLGPDPFNQRAVFEEVGFIHLLSREIWDGHPCCAFGFDQSLIREAPNTYAALFRAVLEAAAMAREARNRELIAKVISPSQYLNQPEAVVAQVLTGRFADGLGNVRDEPNRADFDPVPWYSMAVWMLTQMKRWGYIKGDVGYRRIAEQVFLLSDARKFMREQGMPAPAGDGYRRFSVMKKDFDPMRPDAYVESFPIRR